MKIAINLIIHKYDFVKGPYNFLNKQIRRAKKHQLAWKKVPRPGAFSIAPEPKEFEIAWKIIEVVLVLVLFAYIQFIKLVYFVIYFFRKIFG